LGVQITEVWITEVLLYVRVFNNNSETFTVTPSVVANNEFYLLRNFIAMLNKKLCFVYL